MFTVVLTWKDQSESVLTTDKAGEIIHSIELCDLQ